MKLFYYILFWFWFNSTNSEIGIPEIITNHKPWNLKYKEKNQYNEYI